MDVNSLPASAKKHFEAAANRAVESENPETVLEELETSYLCDGLDTMVRAGGAAAAAIVHSPSGMKATLTDEGFDADTFTLCKKLVTLHEKKMERLRDEKRRRDLENAKNNHGMVLASITNIVDSMLPIGTVDGEQDPTTGARFDESGMRITREESLQRSSFVGSNEEDQQYDSDDSQQLRSQSAGAKKIPLVPPLAPWTTTEERNQAWRERIQLILDVPQGSVVGKAYFVFVSLVVIMSSVTSVVETMPVVNPTVRPQYSSLWNGLEWFATIVFTIDFLGRIYVFSFDSSLPTHPFQNLLQFCKSPVNIIDFITLLPSYIQPAFSGRIVTGNLRTLRLLRLYKVVRRFQGFHRLSLALTRSFSSLVGPLAFLAACVFFLSAVLFAAERGNYRTSQDAFLIADPKCDNQPVSFLGGVIPPGSPCPNMIISNFVSQWQAFWWCVVTMCTVGYGDFTPTSWVGRFVATVAIIVGMVFFSMPIAVVGTNYTFAVLMTSRSEEADKEDALQREDQRDHELVGGATHPGRRMLKLLGELLLVQPDATAPAALGLASPPTAVLNLCAPSLNDLYVIEGVLEAVVTSMIEGSTESQLPLWVARWPAGVRETFRRKEAVYRSAVISRPLILHLGSEGRTADAHQILGPGAALHPGSALGSASLGNRKDQQESAANAVIGTAVTFPEEGSSIPTVIIYNPEIRSGIETAQVQEARRRRQRIAEEEAALRNITVQSGTNDVMLSSLLNNSSNMNNNMNNSSRSSSNGQQLRNRGDSLHDDLEAINPPTVLPHHGTLCCMRVWGEPTFLAFAKSSAKESVLRSTASNLPVPPLDFALLQEHVQNSLRRLFADGMVQSLTSFHQAQLDAASVASSGPSASPGPGGQGDGTAATQGAASFLLDPTKQDLTIEHLVFRHAVMKQQQWLSFELKPVRVKHGDILSFGAAQNELFGLETAYKVGGEIGSNGGEDDDDKHSETSSNADPRKRRSSSTTGAFLNYRFEDNSRTVQ